MIEHFLNATFALANLEKERQQLERDNAQLINGTAKQAATIRTQQQRLSDLEAEVTIEKYNVEFVKQQARKSRFINRNKLRGLKDKITSLTRKLASAEEKAHRAENANHILRQQMSSLIESHAKHCQELAQAHAALDRLLDGEPLPFQIVTEQAPFRATHYSSREGMTFEMDTLEVRQGAIQIRLAPEHRRDEFAHAEVAKQAAAEMAQFIEREVLTALRGKPTNPREVARRSYLKRMRDALDF
jgi:hypothetical protein